MEKLWKNKQKQIDAFQSLNLSNRIDELKQINITFPKNLLNDFVDGNLEEIIQSQNNVELNELDYKAKSRKYYNFSKISLPIIFQEIYTQGFNHIRY